MKNNIKKKPWIRVTICLLLLVLLGYIITDYLHDKNAVPQVCSGENCFTVELARTQAQQELGLMNRTAMAEESGMLFVFPTSDFQNFWMKNTLIPLDMLRIDDQYTVVRILTAQPCIADPCEVYRPEIFAKYVLEINARIAGKYEIKEGTVMKFQNINLPTK